MADNQDLTTDMKNNDSNSDVDGNTHSTLYNHKAHLPTQVLFICGGSGGCKAQFYNFQEQKWHQAGDMLQPRHDFGVAILNSKLYVAGGSFNSIIRNSVEVYDTQLNKWTAVLPMLEKRQSLGFVATDESLYAVGGFNVIKQYLDTCEKYDFTSKKWLSLPPMLHKASKVGVKILNNILYVVGGNYRKRILNTVQAFDLDTQSWSELPSMILPRNSPATWVFNGKLYVGGGESCCIERSVEMFDPLTNSWTLVSNMTICRYEADAFVDNNHIYVVGGRNSKGKTIYSIEVYNPEDNKWSLLPVDLNYNEIEHRAVFINKSVLKSYNLKVETPEDII